MTLNSANPPIILSFSALDPAGAGGLQADIETAASLGCHCAPIATSLFAAGAGANTDATPVDATLLITQARSVLENMQVAAIKVGYLASLGNIEAVHTLLRDYPHIPVVGHPALVLWDADDDELSEIPEAFFSLIVPSLRVGIFSIYEARTVSQESDTIATTAQAITSSGCEYALITGTGTEKPAFRNSSFSHKGLIEHYHWEQEPPTCHGASSTLAMSICAYMAHAGDAVTAIDRAQNFTWQTMCASRELGFNTRTPHRFFWADKNIESPQSLPATTKSH